MDLQVTPSIQFEGELRTAEQVYSYMWSDQGRDELLASRPAEQPINDNCSSLGHARTGVTSVANNAASDPVYALDAIPALRTGLTHYSASMLKGMVFQPPQFLVANLVPQGLTLLAGKPKSGKSWLALDIAAAVATGGEVLSSEATTAGDVLYAALEDTARRMKSRLDIQRDGQTWPDNLTIWHEMSPLDRGGKAELRKWIADHPHAKLIIIDVLNKVRPAKLKNEDSYGHDYRSLVPLKKISDETGVSVIVIHHTRKAAAEDVFDTVSGTLGLTGAADATVILTKDKGGALILAGQGRDVEEFVQAADFDDNRRLMLSQLEATGGQSASRNAVMGALKLGANNVAGICKSTQLSGTVVRSQLQRMMDAREVFSPERGRYELPPVQPSNLWQ